MVALAIVDVPPFKFAVYRFIEKNVVFVEQATIVTSSFIKLGEKTLSLVPSPCCPYSFHPIPYSFPPSMKNVV